MVEPCQRDPRFNCSVCGAELSEYCRDPARLTAKIDNLNKQLDEMFALALENIQRDAATIGKLAIENDRLRSILKQIAKYRIESFGINEAGNTTSITVEGSDRFVHERDVVALLTIARDALKAES